MTELFSTISEARVFAWRECGHFGHGDDEFWSGDRRCRAKQLARAADLREGDVIVALDDKPVAGVDDLHRPPTDAQVGARCGLAIIRHTERPTLSVFPEEAAKSGART
jgi:hypothetical protein